jgi:hypothetical protein
MCFTVAVTMSAQFISLTLLLRQCIQNIRLSLHSLTCFCHTGSFNTYTFPFNWVHTLDMLILPSESCHWNTKHSVSGIFLQWNEHTLFSVARITTSSSNFYSSTELHCPSLARIWSAQNANCCTVTAISYICFILLQPFRTRFQY